MSETRLSEESRKALGESVRVAFRDFKDVLCLTVPVEFRWSTRMTSSAGNVRWTGASFLVKLSAPIFSHLALEDMSEAMRGIRETMMHELCHIPDDGHKLLDHGRRWPRNVRLCGYDPASVRRHNYACGRALYGGDRFRVDQLVEFQHRGIWVEARIIKKNVRKARVQATDGTFWSVPYSCLEG